MRILVLILLALSSVAISQGNFFEPAFGQDGAVGLETIKAKFTPKAALDTQGRIVLSGETLDKMQTVVRLEANGQLDSSFGVLKLRALGQVFVDSQNRVLVVQKKQILRFKINGTLDSSYANKGIFAFPTGTQKTVLPMQKVVFNPDGSIWAALLKSPRVASENPDDDDLTPQLIKITNQGRLDTGIGNKGFADTKLEHPNMRIDALVRTSSGGVVLVSSAYMNSPAGVSTYQPPIWIYRFNQKGQLEPQQKNDDFETLTCTNGGYVDYFGVRSDNTAVLMNSNSGDCNTFKSIWSLDAQNKVQAEFGEALPENESTQEVIFRNNGRVSLSLDPAISSLKKAILWQDGSLMLHGATATTLQIQKLTITGAIDTVFGKKEMPNPFKSTNYTILESKDNKTLLIGLENGVWSVKQMVF